MLTREELEKNYRHFSNARLVNLANEPDGLSIEALDVLKYELQSRELNVQIQPQSLPVDPQIYFPKISDELKLKYPNAIQIFGFEKRSTLVFSLTLFFIGGLFLYVSYPMDGYFTLVKYIGLLFWVLAGFVWFNMRSKNAMLVVLDNEILFKSKWSRNGSKLAIIDLLRLFLSTKFTKIHKSEIQELVRPTNFWRMNNFYFKTFKGDKHEINFYSSDEYLEQLHLYLEKYLMDGDNKKMNSDSTNNETVKKEE